MNKVLLGKYVNTHGVKGEIRIKSNFKYKDKVFKIGNEIIIDKVYTINSYRVHKDYDMVTLKEINSINDINFDKNTLVYIDRDKYLEKDNYLDEDLIGFTVYCNNKMVGNVEEIKYLVYNKKLLVVGDNLIPSELICDINLKDKAIIIKYVEGLVR